MAVLALFVGAGTGGALAGPSLTGGGGVAAAKKKKRKKGRKHADRAQDIALIRQQASKLRGPRGPRGTPGGPPGPPGPVGPSNAIEVTNASSTATPDGVDKTVATLASLPAGSYAISAKANVTRNGGGATQGSCTLAAEGDNDTGLATLNQTLAVGSTIAVQLTHTFAATGSATLSCSGIGGSTIATKIRLVAIKVGTASSTAVTG
ncbi:MAG: hypothetical protein E6G56_15140 [Actinobacteria bacterium]|nr:MAG: hypothetical protein E6G56_15140 [Actinomycetota bacterium]